MAITLFPVTNDFAAEIGDIDLHHPLAADDLQGVRDALARYAVLFFPAQDLSAEQHMAFAAHFGPLERSLQVTMSRGQPLRLREEVADIANLDANGQLWQKDSRMRVFQMMANRLWHTDSSFNAPSGYVSLLYARSVSPIGGHTQFADLRAAYDTPLHYAPRHRIRRHALAPRHAKGHDLGSYRSLRVSGNAGDRDRGLLSRGSSHRACTNWCGQIGDSPRLAASSRMLSDLLLGTGHSNSACCTRFFDSACGADSGFSAKRA
jgi:alpha-ketoglutarate-dependent taurine dioxygenase